MRIQYNECFFARKVNFYRDIFPQKITDSLMIITSGHGMQTRCRGIPTDFFSDEPFSRTNEHADAGFYTESRLVTHIDDRAISVISYVYGQTLNNGMKVLDLMSSWRSHVPENLKLDSLMVLESGRDVTEYPTHRSCHT